MCSPPHFETSVQSIKECVWLIKRHSLQKTIPVLPPSQAVAQARGQKDHLLDKIFPRIAPG